MRTFQDYEKAIADNVPVEDFIYGAILDYQSSKEYKTAKIADDYSKQRNTTIMEYEKMLYTVTGEAIPDTISANHKLASNFYNKFNVQECQYLLSNGATFTKDDTKDKLGTGKKAFDTQLQKVGKKALTHGVAYGFYNLDHIDVFSALEFVPLYDEENGAIKAGIRFWQIDDSKPLRMTFFEMDGYTEYEKDPKKERTEILKEKRAYVLNYRESAADGKEIYGGENYNGFPVVPLWGNGDHLCNIEAWRRKIDCYDLIASGMANDVDDASLIYWVVENAGGMDDTDLAKFIQRIKQLHAVTLDDDGARATAHTQDAPVQARETYLAMLKNDIMEDAMALDTNAIARGNTVATAIRAAYEPLNNKTDDFEYCVIEFVQGILELAGIDDDVTFKRSTIINQSEETQMVLSAAQLLDKETVLNHLPFLSPDEIPAILERTQEEEMARNEMNLQMAAAMDGIKNGNNPEENPEEESEE